MDLTGETSQNHAVAEKAPCGLTSWGKLRSPDPILWVEGTGSPGEAEFLISSVSDHPEACVVSPEDQENVQGKRTEPSLRGHKAEGVRGRKEKEQWKQGRELATETHYNHSSAVGRECLVQWPMVGTERVRPLCYTQINTPTDRKLKTRFPSVGGQAIRRWALLQQVCFFLEVGAPSGCLASTSEEGEKFNPAHLCHLILLLPSSSLVSQPLSLYRGVAGRKPSPVNQSADVLFARQQPGRPQTAQGPERAMRAVSVLAQHPALPRAQRWAGAKS